jgi:transcriptional regulator with XRE-family HTH domain
VNAAQLLRQARLARRVSQRDLARRGGVQQPAVAAVESGRRDPTVATLDRLLGALGYGLVALPTRRASVAATAEQIRSDLAAHDETTAFRRLLQINKDLAAEGPVIRVALCAPPPPLTGDPRLDAFVAALVEHHLGRDGLPVPTWVDDSPPLVDPWFVVDLPAFRDDALTSSPAAFKQRNIYVNASELDAA